MGRGASCIPLGGSGIGLPVQVILPGIGRFGQIPLPGDALLSPLVPPSTYKNPLRFSPNFEVLGFTPQNNVVSSIHLEGSVGFDVPMVHISLVNLNKQISSTILAKEQSTFDLKLGFNNPGTQNHGRFIVQRPKFKFMSKQMPLSVDIIGYGEAVKLGATERREVYKKQSDVDIARKIADRNGFDAEVEDTDPVHDQVIQANESDWKFLSRRAKLYGFMLYVEDSVLHFHRPRPRESGIKLTYLEKGQGNLQDFVVHSRTFMRGLKLQMTQIDPITKEEFTADSTEEADPVQDMTEFKNWKDLVSIEGVGQPQRFITNEGHEQQRPLLKDQMLKMAQASRYVIAGSGTVAGLETLRANDLITINGVGRSSGKYYITKIIHQVNSGTGGLGEGYNVRFEVVRAGAGELTDVRSSTITSPESAGTVSL
jgi:phage protein D